MYVYFFRIRANFIRANRIVLIIYRAYSYYIDVSMDQNDWVRVIDHTKFSCRSWQDLYFPPRVVRFIRVVGTHNTVNKVFHLVALEAYFTKKQFQLDKHGILSKNLQKTFYTNIVLLLQFLFSSKTKRSYNSHVCMCHRGCLSFKKCFAKRRHE